MSGYSSFILTEYTRDIYAKHRHLKLECSHCHKALVVGDKVKLHNCFPFWFMHFECWRRHVKEKNQREKELKENKEAYRISLAARGLRMRRGIY